MMELENLVMIGAGAVFPYVAVAILDWVKDCKAHANGADAPR